MGRNMECGQATKGEHSVTANHVVSMSAFPTAKMQPIPPPQLRDFLWLRSGFGWCRLRPLPTPQKDLQEYLEVFWTVASELRAKTRRPGDSQKNHANAETHSARHLIRGDGTAIRVIYNPLHVLVYRAIWFTTLAIRPCVKKFTMYPLIYLSIISNSWR